jgi:hypothetical protein
MFCEERRVVLWYCRTPYILVGGLLEDEVIDLADVLIRLITRIYRWIIC